MKNIRAKIENKLEIPLQAAIAFGENRTKETVREIFFVCGKSQLIGVSKTFYWVQ